MDAEARIRQRYFRKVQAHPEGAVVHHGDCEFFSIRVCTCGLLADLRAEGTAMAAELFPEFHVQLADQEGARERLLHPGRASGRKRKTTGG